MLKDHGKGGALLRMLAEALGRTWPAWAFFAGLARRHAAYAGLRLSRGAPDDARCVWREWSSAFPGSEYRFLQECAVVHA